MTAFTRPGRGVIRLDIPQSDPSPASSVETFGQVDLDVVTVVLADGRSDGGSYRELVGAVSQSHERTGERVPVDRAGDLDQTTSPEGLC